MLDALLAVQELDTTLDQLAHRRTHLPEQVERDELRTQQATMTAQRASRAEVRDGLALDERRLEDEASAVEAKVGSVQQTMYATTSPKELVAMQHEVETLQARQRQLEDEAIELMEQIEPVDAELAEADAALAVVAARLVELDVAIDAAVTSIDEEVRGLQASRGEHLVGVDDALLATYDELRGHLGGVAVARFEAGRCTGCHLSLSAVEADHVRHAAADEIVRCPECNRMLAR